MSRILYLSYDGMTDPLGQAQVIPYLKGLAQRGHQITLLSCEKPNRRAASGSAIDAALRGQGIEWVPLPYTKRPPIASTAIDLFRMWRTALRLASKKSYDVVHCRSYLPAIVGASLKRRTGVSFLFDMRGFWPDEKVEGGSWPLTSPLYGFVYRTLKRVERSLFADADALVSLTRAGLERVSREFPRAPGQARVIPCSVDLEQFRPPSPAERQAARRKLGIEENAIVVTYLGSLGTWYMLDEMLDMLAVMEQRYPTLHFLCVTPDEPGPVLSGVEARGLSRDQVTVTSAQRSEVPGLLAASDLGLFFIRSTPSKVGSSPTKLGEYMAMGIPVITNRGIGDVDAQLQGSKAGVVIEEFRGTAYQKAIGELETLIHSDPSSRREQAESYYDLSQGVEIYDELYRRLAEP